MSYSFCKSLRLNFINIFLLTALLSISVGAAPLNARTAPDFTATTLDGKVIHLSDYHGKKPVHLIFWATWCPACKHEIPYFKALHTKYGKDIEMIAVNVDALSLWSSLSSSNKRVKRYKEKHQLPYTIVLDDSEVLSKLYKVRGTPTQFIIDKDGLIRYTFHIIPEDIENKLKTIL